jgi:tetratricopeptide (TPR) repeat protein
MRRLLILPVLALLGAAPQPPVTTAPVTPKFCGEGPSVAATTGPVDLLSGYGKGGFAIRTSNARAQAYFDNGMQLAHAFAHKAAIAAFQEARRLDPACAMCAWGEAWSSGPTINYGIGAEERKKLAVITATAERLAANGPASERALIAALKLRYADERGNRAFAEAMDAMAKASPGDNEIVVLAADALMIDSDYRADRMPRPVALLESVLKRDPDYAPAIHFYIHATELAGYPDRATPYADKLAALAPAASHLVHMPSHTYYWIGRYADAAKANVRAVEISDDNAKRLKLAEPDGRWTLAYYGHNVSFGIGGALMADDAASGLALARPVVAMAARAGDKIGGGRGSLERAYVAIARFAPVEEMLAIPDPGAANASARVAWRYARGEALARRGDADGVQSEAHALEAEAKPHDQGDAAMLKVAQFVLQGRAAMMRDQPREAARSFARAAKVEEAKLGMYSDPPRWWYPVRRDLAAALLASGVPERALTEADASLKRRPHDAVALAVRAKAEMALSRKQEAAADRADARRSWRGDPRAIG